MTPGPAPVPTTQAQQSWTSGAKDVVMTAVNGSRVWATVGQGIVNEVYWPAVDQPEVKDLGFLVAGNGWWREVKRVDGYSLTLPDPAIALPTVTHTGSGPGRSYTLTLRPVVHPRHDVLLVEYTLTGDATHLHPLLAPHLQISQFVADPAQVALLGADNSAWVDPSDRALFASGSGRFLCLLASPGFTGAGVGYVGDTDGWTDLARNGRMTYDYTQAGPGVVALTGAVDPGSGLLALGFGVSADEARRAAQAGLDAGYDAAATAFAAGWNDWISGLTLPAPAAAPSGLSEALRQSAVVLRSHADHTVAGGYVAGLAVPWGQDTNDPGGYHQVWCRDGGESALALAAVGHADDAMAALEYLVTRQNADGSWPRCFFVSDVPHPVDPNAAVQLDEVAFPVLLAGKLDELGLPGSAAVDDAVRRAGSYLARSGPVSDRDVDRWEENNGASPFTLGLEIVALVVAATRLAGNDRTLALDLADNWNERLEEFTFVGGDEVDAYFGTDGHYVRIGQPLGNRIFLSNQPPDTEPLEAAALVGLEFLYLPRLGLRSPADSRITQSLRIAEAMLAVTTPSGRGFRRYDVDGYGEWLDGSGWPRRHFGIGRLWPLLTGERGHFEVLAGGTASAELAAMLAMRGPGGLLPEQTWDTGPLPWRGLEPGRPTGSAMPLAWAHSELIKLAVTTARRLPVEQLQLVTSRYPGGAVPQSARWFWRDLTPVASLPSGRDLVVADTRGFALHYGFDDWDSSTIAQRPSTPLGLGLSGVTLTAAQLQGHQSLQFVRRYDDGSWESSRRHDVALQAGPPAAVQLHPRHLAALVAAGIADPSAPA